MDGDALHSLPHAPSGSERRTDNTDHTTDGSLNLYLYASLSLSLSLARFLGRSGSRSPRLSDLPISRAPGLSVLSILSVLSGYLAHSPRRLSPAICVSALSRLSPSPRTAPRRPRAAVAPLLHRSCTSPRPRKKHARSLSPSRNADAAARERDASIVKEYNRVNTGLHNEWAASIQARIELKQEAIAHIPTAELLAAAMVFDEENVPLHRKIMTWTPPIHEEETKEVEEDTSKKKKTMSLAKKAKKKKKKKKKK